MTERLRTVVLAAERLSPAEQDALATHIEAFLPPVPSSAGVAAIDFSVFADLPDDAVEVLDRLRHDAAPTPAYAEP